MTAEELTMLDAVQESYQVSHSPHWDTGRKTYVSYTSNPENVNDIQRPKMLQQMAQTGGSHSPNALQHVL